MLSPPFTPPFYTLATEVTGTEGNLFEVMQHIISRRLSSNYIIKYQQDRQDTPMV